MYETASVTLPDEIAIVCRGRQYVRRMYTLTVSELRFEWDEPKSRSNEKKHRVSFEEAQTAFYDDRAVIVDDPDQVTGEQRFVLLGMSASLRMLVVCHCIRARGDVIRLISARKATREEQHDYPGSSNR